MEKKEVKGLIIVAHGSRKKGGKDQLSGLCKTIREKEPILFDRVEPAFLQFSPPFFGEVIDTMAEDGVDHILVFPFFMAPGSHLLQDIPGIISKAEKKYPGVCFSLTPHLGAVKGIEDLVISQVRAFI